MKNFTIDKYEILNQTSINYFHKKKQTLNQIAQVQFKQRNDK